MFSQWLDIQSNPIRSINQENNGQIHKINKLCILWPPGYEPSAYIHIVIHIWSQLSSWVMGWVGMQILVVGKGSIPIASSLVFHILVTYLNKKLMPSAIQNSKPMIYYRFGLVFVLKVESRRECPWGDKETEEDLGFFLFEYERV